jgi:hypothetical protein
MAVALGMMCLVPGVRPGRVLRASGRADLTILTISATSLIVNSVNIAYDRGYGALH